MTVPVFRDQDSQYVEKRGIGIGVDGLGSEVGTHNYLRKPDFFAIRLRFLRGFEIISIFI
jgi:hypothetical protein